VPARKDLFSCPGESPWLAGRIALVGRENQIEDDASSSPPPLWPPKREYNAVSTIADEIWQYRTGGNLTIFDKDHGTAEEGRSQVRQKQSSYGFATTTCTRFGEPAYRSEIYFFFKGGWKLVVHQTVGGAYFK